jgi:hypothetical protein
MLFCRWSISSCVAWRASNCRKNGRSALYSAPLWCMKRTTWLALSGIWAETRRQRSYFARRSMLKDVSLTGPTGTAQTRFDLRFAALVAHAKQRAAAQKVN